MESWTRLEIQKRKLMDGIKKGKGSSEQTL